MATPQVDRERLLKQAKGLSYLRTGEAPRDGAFDSFNDDQLLRQIREYRTSINQNWDLDVPASEENGGEPVSFGEAQPSAPLGTKDRLIGLIELELAEGGVLPGNDALAVKAAMTVSGYNVDLDSDVFSADEEAALGRFRNNINTLSLEAIANNNFAAAAADEAERVRLQQEQETLALSDAELKDSVASMLVYGGYLAPEDAENDKRIASALNVVISLKSPYEDQVADQESMFVDFENWQLTNDAAVYLRANLGDLNPQNPERKGDLLRQHLESGDPALIKLAQGYLANQPGNEGLEINGIIDGATYNAAIAEMQSEIELPAGAYDAEGELRGDKIMEYAVRGQLYLPVEMLSAEDRALYDSLPFAADRGPGDVNCKERLLADRLILDDPEGYARLLAEENARRATATFELETLPVVAVPPTATIVEEQLDIAQNPAGLLDNPEGDAVMDASQPIVDGIKEHGIGVTDRSGFVVFGEQSVALSGIVDAIKQDQGAFGDGNADNLISMAGAINLVRGAVSAQDIDLTGISIPLTPDHVWAINESLGYDRDHSFDIANPVELEAVLNGIITHQNVTAAGVPFTQDFIAEHTTIHREDVKNAVGIASGVIPAEPEAAPAEEPQEELVSSAPCLTSNFATAHDHACTPADTTPAVVPAGTDPRLAMAYTR